MDVSLTILGWQSRLTGLLSSRQFIWILSTRDLAITISSRMYKFVFIGLLQTEEACLNYFLFLDHQPLFFFRQQISRLSTSRASQSDFPQSIPYPCIAPRGLGVVPWSGQSALDEGSYGEMWVFRSQLIQHGQRHQLVREWRGGQPKTDRKHGPLNLIYRCEVESEYFRSGEDNNRQSVT